MLRRIWRRVENILFVLMLILIVCYFVLQSSLVQNWLIAKITGYLSEELHTTVQINHVDISFFDNLVLENLFVADQKGDTLLFAEKFSAGLNSNIFSLLTSKLEFNEISLTHARFNLRRAEGETDNNLQFILDYFSNPDAKPKSSTPFRIRVQNLKLNDVQFLSDDRVRGKRIFARIPTGIIQVNNLDLPSKIVDVQTLTLIGPTFSITEFPSRPLPSLTSAGAKPVALKSGNAATTDKPLRITVVRLSLQEGFFAIDKPNNTSSSQDTLPEVMDFRHLAVRDIALEADSVYADDDLNFHGIIKHLSGKERCGFSVTHLEANAIHITDTLAAMYGMRLQTPYSSLSDSVAFRYSTYRDFNKFNDRVRMEGRFDNQAAIRLGDIMHFSPAVARNSFFKTNKDEVVQISGRVDGFVNRLNGRDLNIQIGGDTYIQGDFDGNDMAEGSDRIRLLFDLKSAQTNMKRVRKIIPGSNAPEFFDRLGNINFKGFYEIFFSSNHILAGSLVTDIGYGDVDMKLDLAGGREKATYSGFLHMNDFDLAKWTGNPDFGKSTFRVNIANGNGLVGRSLRAQLTGVVDSFYFRGYNYQNVDMNGSFNQSIFDGKLTIEDPNIDFTFDGAINFKDSVPVYDFKADLRRLDLGALNLVKEDWVISGKVQKIKLYAKNLNNLSGSISLRDFRLIQDKEFVHRIDSLTFAAINRPGGDRYFILLSDIADGQLQGHFELNRLVDNLKRLFYRQFPQMMQQALGPPPTPETVLTDDYKFNLQIKSTRGLTRLVDPKLDTLRNLSMRAAVNAREGSTEFKLLAPSFKYNGLTLQRTDLFLRSTQTNGYFDFQIPNALLANGQQLANIHCTGTITPNNINFSLATADDSQSIVQRINLNGDLSTIDSLWQIKFNTSDITLFNEQWVMEEDNYLRFSSTYFDAHNFDLMNGLQRIVIDSFNQGHGALFSLANFDLNFLERFFPLNNIHYRGKIYNLDVELYDLFGLKDFKGYITTDTVFLNEKPYGSLIGNVELYNLESPLWWKLFLSDKDKHQLRVVGAMPLDKKEHIVEEVGKVRPGEFQTLISTTNFPMGALELIVPGISKTSGTVNANVKLGGPFKRVGMNGQAMVNGKFQLDYMKAMFYIPDQKITLTEYQLWADSATILDGSQRHKAHIYGGLRHDHFRDWRLDCSIKSENDSFMILNTLREDNTLYYGQGIGKFEAKFTGSFSKTNIYINAVTGKDTRLYIPLYSNSDIQDASFITFRDKTANPAQDAKENTKSFILEDIKGLNLEMNLSVTDEAEVQLIFDEQSGDIVKGRGEGDLRMTINREGEFKMYGTYQIRRGEYLFTLLNWVNKPFTVAEGGSINWYGDPYGAQISLDATYAENTSLYNLLRDELAASSGDLTDEATISTKAVVTMHLKGDLFKPAITFDLAFPSSSSSIKSLVDSKLSQLRQDQNEMTRQVFGLVVVGSFLPPSSGGAGTLQSSDYLASAFNTLTQVLSNQFSGYLTGLATEWFGGAVSSIDFDIAYNEYRNVQANPDNTNLAQIGRELQVRLTSGFVNDRITVQLGSQFGLGQPGTATSDGFLGEDVTVEIQLTQNREWRLKVYQRTEPDVAGGARRSRYGFGISFRKEYASFSDLMSGLTGWFHQKKK
ncbi:MAG: translocation/assembly module TamB domain-containing protein [Saprospiraceae bacterium]|nr:translocation/assembly module TamB domain-containing protein [Saprospiraceae bacterium]